VNCPFTNLIQSADNDLERASRGIIIIDEIDNVCIKEFDDELVGVAQAMEWLSHHFLKLDDDHQST